MSRVGSGSSAPLSRSGRPLLFALADGGLPTASLLRALTLARALEVQLHVLRVVLGRWPISPTSPQVDLLTITRSTEYVVQSDRSLREWLKAFSPSGWSLEDVCTRSGDFVRHVAAHAREIDASLIMVSPGESRAGQASAKLACAAQLPVLVARQATFQESIVAATDLREPTYPVLRTAAALSRRLDAPVIALHNMSPVALSAPEQIACPATLDTLQSRDRAREHLEHALSRLSEQSTAVVADEVDLVAAILREAQARNVGLITVGTRPRSWFERLLSSSVAARVIDGTERSVLVVPIGAVHASFAQRLAC